MAADSPARFLVALVAFAAAPVAAQGVVPDAVRARVTELVAACIDAGGTLGDMEGQGRFVVPADFNGDGHTDFVVSEGNVPCAGRPQLFREGGLSRVELYTGSGAADATLAFADRLLAYRVVAGRPARLQIGRRGDACGEGSPAAARCGAELRWNAGAARFDEVPTGSDGGAAQVAVRPAAGARTGAAAPAGAAATALPVRPDARARHLERCRGDHRRLYPDMGAEAVAGSCDHLWDKAVAAGPLADLVLAAVPARVGERLTVMEVRARLPRAQWDARPSTGGHPPPVATGRVAGLEAWVGGTAAEASQLVLRWSQVGGDPPYDLPGALAARGAQVDALGCHHFGIVEVTTAHVVHAPGRPPFALMVHTLGAPLAQSTAAQTFTIALDGVLPTRAGLRAQHRDPAWEDPCPV